MWQHVNAKISARSGIEEHSWFYRVIHLVGTCIVNIHVWFVDRPHWLLQYMVSTADRVCLANASMEEFALVIRSAVWRDVLSAVRVL